MLAHFGNLLLVLGLVRLDDVGMPGFQDAFQTKAPRVKTTTEWGTFKLATTIDSQENALEHLGGVLI